MTKRDDAPQMISRRALLGKIGLAAGAAYVAPTLAGMNAAHASTASRPSQPSRPDTRPSRPSRPSRSTSPGNGSRPAAQTMPLWMQQMMGLK